MFDSFICDQLLIYSRVSLHLHHHRCIFGNLLMRFNRSGKPPPGETPRESTVWTRPWGKLPGAINKDDNTLWYKDDVLK